MTQAIVLKENPPCPVCGSESSKSGKDKRGAEAVQIYICKKCGKRFRENYVLNVKVSPKYVRGKTRKRTSKVRVKIPIPDLSPLFKKPLDVDSVVGIPCFCCFENFCDPSTCERLDEWLNKECD